MGVLTDDLTRLRNEILALRGARQGLIQDLERETEDRRVEVSRMLADFSEGFGVLAGRTKADRLGSISDLKRTVTDLVTEVRTDLSGIRQAWLAPDSPSGTSAEQSENQAGLETGAHAEGRRSETVGKRPLVPAGEQKPARKKRRH
jgi:hypothetical protein